MICGTRLLKGEKAQAPVVSKSIAEIHFEIDSEDVALPGRCSQASSKILVDRFCLQAHDVRIHCSSFLHSKGPACNSS